MNATDEGTPLADKLIRPNGYHALGRLDCPTCSGNGYLGDDVCTDCHGSGTPKCHGCTSPAETYDGEHAWCVGCAEGA